MIGSESYSTMNQHSTFVKRKNETKVWRTKNDKCVCSCSYKWWSLFGFWDVITWEGTSCFPIYNENTDNAILNNYLVPTVQLYSLENNCFFQHDNARYYTSKQTQAK